MEFLADIASFALKTIFISSAIILIAGMMFQMRTSRRRIAGHLDIENINDRFNTVRRRLQSELLNKKDFKRYMKDEKKADKKAEKNRDKSSISPARPRLFVLDFDGDIRASQTEALREEVTALLSVAKPEDEVMVRVESGGGLVTGYGLAASQLARLRKEQIKLTIAIDKVAASGGYMMACVGDRILAAPFAVVGSIGVIAQVPNFNKVLKKHDVDYREVTAGEFKRTLTVFGEITDTGMNKFREQIEDTHRLFKEFVNSYRPSLDISRVATGEHWYATQAIGLGLVDEVMTSDDYLFRRSKDADIYKIRYVGKKKWMERFSEAGSDAAFKLLTKLTTGLERGRFGS